MALARRYNTSGLVILEAGAAWPTGLPDGTLVAQKRAPSITETWTGTNGAAWPSPWTVVAGTATIQGNAGRIVSAAVAYTEGTVSRTGPPDGDLRVRFRFTTTGERYAMVHFRRTDSANLYRVTVNETGINLAKVVANSTTVLVATVAFATVQNTWYQLRVHWEGTALWGKAWADGATEPASWQCQTTDSAFTVGAIALSAMPGADAVAETVEWDDLSVVDLR